MDTKKPEPRPAVPDPPGRPRYEAPRILSKRPVEHVTLVTGDGGPGGDVGGD